MRPDITLHAIVDAGQTPPDRLADLARLAARNGATLIQYRDKDGATRDMVRRAEAILRALRGSGVPLLVNDRVDVALAAGADGVHLGREDMAPADARRLLGEGAVVGATVKTAGDAEAAIAAPIDYACIGGVFRTLSKRNPDAPLGLAGFRALRRMLAAARPNLPVGAIAGIGLAEIPALVAAGADGVAVISAISAAPDPAAAARALRSALDAARLRAPA